MFIHGKTIKVGKYVQLVITYDDHLNLNFLILQTAKHKSGTSNRLHTWPILQLYSYSYTVPLTNRIFVGIEE